MDHVETVLGEVEDPLLPEGALDIVFMINVYHHVDDPVELLRAALPSFRPSGVLAIVECDPEKVEWGAEHGCMQKDEMVRELERAGFRHFS